MRFGSTGRKRGLRAISNKAIVCPRNGLGSLRSGPWKSARSRISIPFSVVAVESSFNPHARSGAGAEGLMQVMTEVHLDKFRAFGGAGAALEAYPNMVVGSEILRGLIERTGSVSKALKWYSGAANHASDYGYGKKVLLERSRLVEAASGQPDKAVALLKSKRQGATYASSVKERKLSYEAWTNVREGRGLRVVTPSERRVEEPSV